MACACTGERWSFPRAAAGVLHGLQFIGASGAKRFLKGARVHGLYCLLGSPGNEGRGEPHVAARDVVCVVEGFATGASVHEAIGPAVAVAFHAGNLAAVAKAISDRHPQASIVVCADDDRDTPGNPGLTHARQAALVAGGLLAIPDFGPDRPAGRRFGLQRPVPASRTVSSADGGSRRRSSQRRHDRRCASGQLFRARLARA
jgi:putative DNA primase/helicase